MPDDFKFTVAVLTDTHIRAPQGDLTSPFKVNERANARARYAVEVVKANTPDLTVHLGDMVHPLPHLPAYGAACAEAHRIFAPLMPKLHYVPGNHDIGDKPGPASPAGPVTDNNCTAYEAAFGPPWKSFENCGVRFIVINSSLVNTGGDAEQRQRDWLEKTLREAEGQRVFLFSHYPPFIDQPDEEEHYDNYAEPGRSWLLGLAVDHGVEAIFSGHVHQFFFNRYRGVKLYCLQPTSFNRQDYAELYRGAPANEFGRDDVDKYGVTFIDIFADGHRLRIAPTHGREIAPGECPQIQKLRQPATPLIPHMRHAWFEASTLPYNGPMEEFGRKRARNDYPLLRLWQLGIRTIRTPLRDLTDPVSRRRVLDFAAAGIQFSFFTLGLPDAASRELLAEHSDLVAGLEVVGRDKTFSDLQDGLIELIEQWRKPLSISKSTSSADETHESGAFAHNVSTGFLWKERDEVVAAASKLATPTMQLGLSFQVNLDEDPGQRIPELAECLSQSNLRLAAVIRLADRNPANSNFDDDKIAAQLVAALEAARDQANVEIQCDTFEDIDRGYSPRHGLLDRRSNLRPISNWIVDNAMCCNRG